jgi:hypothetical protein
MIVGRFVEFWDENLALASKDGRCGWGTARRDWFGEQSRSTMNKELEDKVDPTKPALVVLFGATRRKVRPLLGDVVVVGRATGCDIGLVSPEVAPVHCVLVRVDGGWRIRDTSGRSTLVNGKPVLDEKLSNGDVIHVGTFSFEAHLPPPPRPANPAPSAQPFVDAGAEYEIERLNASRRRFAELALSLRRRNMELKNELANWNQKIQDLEQSERKLRQMHHEAVTKLNEAKRNQGADPELERKILARADELDAYAKHLKRQADRLNQQRNELDKQIERDREEYEAELLQQRLELQEQHRRLEQLQSEVAARNAQLEDDAADLERSLLREKELFEQDRDQVAAEREALEQDREQIASERQYLDQIRGELILDRNDIQRQRSELQRQLADLNRRQGPATPVPAQPAIDPSDTIHDTHLEPTITDSMVHREIEEGKLDRLASARKMLREIAEKRKAASQSPLKTLLPSKPQPPK